MNKIKNLGVILGTRPSDYTAGVLPYEIRNPSGDWTPYVVKGELQFSPREDWMDCVSRSATNSIEIQEKFLTGIESNYCDREVAKSSGTTNEGNYLYIVADYIRHTGLGQQSTYPDSAGDWSEQYQTIPLDTKAKLDAEKADWMSKWSILHEDIPFTKSSLQYHLKHAPLQVVVPNHAVVDIFSNKDIERLFDSYLPFVKTVPPDYSPIIFAKKIVLYKKEQALDPDTLLVDLKFGDTGSQVLRLRRALTRLGWFSSSGDVYDKDLTRTVYNYCLANLSHFSWSYWWQVFYYRGRFVGITERDNINQALKYRK